jgi:O-antigen ligase
MPQAADNTTTTTAARDYKMSNSRSIVETIWSSSIERLQQFFTGSLALIGGIALLLVLSSYVFGYFQPVRWPTLFYFQVALIVTLLSERRGVMLVIFLLPLVPTLHWQLQFFYRPAVPYFVASAGIDLVSGLLCGLLLNRLSTYKSFRFSVSAIPWPLGLLAWVIALSTALAIARNLWLSTSPFVSATFLHQALRFKLFLRGNDFSPLSDWLAISLGLLFLATLASWLRQQPDKAQLVFKPTIASLFVSACYGIYQAFTKTGLPQAAVEYRPESFGYSAIGFQPDIHAYAAHMLLGTVGLLGALSLLKSARWRYFAYLTMVLCWAALYLSKSRASLVFSLFACAVVIFLVILQFLRNKSKAVAAVSTVVGCGFIATLIWLSPWLHDIFLQLQNPQLLTFEHLNILSSRRLELFATALQMFAHYPLLGLGQGNFLLSSAVVPFSGSVWMAQSGGENAHNYFLQTLADVGVVGAICYVLVFVWPLCQTKERKALVPAAVAIFGLCLGNLYSHSFIIRDNLLLLCVFMGLTYSYVDPISLAVNKANSEAARGKAAFELGVLSALTILVTITFAMREVVGSFDRLPFQQASTCNRHAPIRGDGWTTGQVTIPLAAQQKGLKIWADTQGIPTQSAVRQVSLVLLDTGGIKVFEQQYHLDSNKLTIDLQIPESLFAMNKPLTVSLKMDRCYTPSNVTVSEDMSRLGIHIERIERY